MVLVKPCVSSSSERCKSAGKMARAKTYEFLEHALIKGSFRLSTPMVLLHTRFELPG